MMLFLILTVLYTTSLKSYNMLKDVTSIKGVGHSFEAIDDVLAVIATDGTCKIYRNFNVESQATIEGLFSRLGVYSESELYLIGEGFTSKVVKLNSLETNDIPYQVEIILGNRIITSEKEERNRYLSCRLRNGEIKWNILLKRGKHIFLNQDILVNSQYLDDGQINAYDLSDGSVIWNYDTTTLCTWQDYDGSEKQTQVTKVLGIYEDKIYIYLNSGRILLLDIASGKKIAVFENDKNTDQGSFSGMFMNAIELDNESGKLIQLFNQRYTEVDLESNAVTQIHLDDLKEQEMTNMSRFVFDSDHIYFTDKNIQMLGALNRSTLKLDWTHKLSQEGVSESEQPKYGRELKLKGDRLYVLDNKNTLHIFEKESTQRKLV